MVIRLTVLFMVIVNLQTLAQENTQTVLKELPALKTDQPPTIDGVLNDVPAGKMYRKRPASSTNALKSQRRTNRSVGSFTQIQPSTSDFTSTMICPIKSWHAKPKTKHEFVGKIGYPSVLIRFIRTSFLTEISLS